MMRREEITRGYRKVNAFWRASITIKIEKKEYKISFNSFKEAQNKMYFEYTHPEIGALELAVLLTKTKAVYILYKIKP